MYTKPQLISLALFVFALTACGGAATPVSIAQAPQPTQLVAATVVVNEVAYPTLAPAATQASVLLSPAPTASPLGLSPLPTPLPAPNTIPTPADNYFQNYGVNPFVETYADHLSTFALDVDTASYAVARRYVMDGNLPPADAVRVEEFVNYFEQDYAIPADVAFGLYADGALSPFHTDNTYLIRVGVQGYDVPASERKPASLTFVIDISGSMAAENRLELVKRSLQLLVDRLRPSDTVAIVVYGTDARVALLPTSGEDRATILNAIYSLYPEGATNAEAGLRLGYQLAWQAFRPDGINRVVLCSDGVANVGATGPDAILESIRAYADQGVTLTAVGFGMGNFNDTLLEQLADKGDGNYAYVDDIDEAQKLFVEDLTATLQVIALNAKVQVDFNAEIVARYRLLGYENRAVADENFRNDTVDAGEIGAGHSATALYAVQFKPGANGRVATVQLRWENPQSHQVTEINGNFNTWDVTPLFENTSPRYQLDVVVAQYAEYLRRSPYAAGTSLRALLPHAARLAETLSGDSEVSEFAGLVSRAMQISGN